MSWTYAMFCPCCLVWGEVLTAKQKGQGQVAQSTSPGWRAGGKRIETTYWDCP